MQSSQNKCAFVLLMILFLSVFAGCAGGDNTAGAHAASSEGMMAQLIKDEETPPDDASAQDASPASAPVPDDAKEANVVTPEQTQSDDADNIDIDLTAMSSTMVYATVSDMVYHPEQYVGQTVRMNGSFVLAYGDSEDVFYYACLVEDATACCAQGIEFVRDGSYSYPEDYPALGDDITVTGVFEIYIDDSDGLEYLHLVDAQMRPGL